MRKIHQIADNLEEVFQLAEERSIGTHTAAQLLAELRIEKAKAQQPS